MGEPVNVLAVEAENDGTLIQVDFEVGGKKDRMFIEVRQIFKALNNFAYEAHDRHMLANGAELVDPENYRNPNLIV